MTLLSLTLNCLRLSVEFPVDWRISIKREPLGANAIEHSSPFKTSFDKFQVFPKSSEKIEWLRMDVLAPAMCRRSGVPPVAWSQLRSAGKQCQTLHYRALARPRGVTLSGEQHWLGVCMQILQARYVLPHDQASRVTKLDAGGWSRGNILPRVENHLRADVDRQTSKCLAAIRTS